MRVFISGQKYFAAQVLRLCLSKRFEVVGVCCPLGDRHIGDLARANGIQITEAGTLNINTFPKQPVDLAIAAHSFDYIGKATRYKPRLGWIGYHPSLLPRHRGRSSVEWAIRMRDAITGGTIYWLNSGVDCGDIAYQDWCFIDPALFAMDAEKAARILWREQLSPIGVKLFGRALDDISRGLIVKVRQDNRFATWEPGTSPQMIFRPDLLMLDSGRANTANGVKTQSKHSDE